MLSISFEEDAKKIKSVLFEEENISAKENILIDIIKKYNLKQRLLLRVTYDQIFPENNFLTDINTNLTQSMQFCNLVTSLFMDQVDIDCIEFKKIFDKISTNTSLILETITLNPFWYNQKLIKAYKEFYNKDLKSEIFKGFPENMRDAIITCMNTKRNDINKEIDLDEINEKVKLLIKTNPEDILKNNEIFINIFALPSPKELIMIARIYKEKKGENLLNLIDNKLSEEEAMFLKEVIYNVCRPSEYFAYKLSDSIKGIKVDENNINRILVMRNELDMKEIRNFYQKFNNQDFDKEIANVFDGAYKELLQYLYTK
jgi:hypothetical protein